MSEVTEARQAYRETGWWRDQTFIDDLRRNAAQQPAKTAVIGHSTDTGRTDTVDYAELSRLTGRMAHGLAGLGVRRGEWVAIMLPDCWEMFPLALACIQAGLQIVPISPEFRRAEMEHAFRLTGARLFITAPDFSGFRPAEAARELARDGGLPEQIVVFGDDRPDGTLSFAEHFLAPGETAQSELAGRCLTPDEPFLLLFTSGTTGTTKAVLHSQNTLHSSIRGYAEALGLDHTLVTTTAHSNMYYVGLVVRLLTTVFLGGTAVCLERWDPAASLDLIERHGVTTFYGSPHFMRQLLAAARSRPLRDSRLTSVVSGSAPVPPQLARQAREVLGVRLYSLWGMSENGAVTCTRPDDPQDWAAHSDGRPTGGMEVRIDPLPGQDDGAGPLWVRGASQCLGYYKQDDIYAASLDAQGWFDTGDLARSDGRGGIRITGRAKDIIIHQSSNLPVAEIEALLGNHPKVADVALIGIPDPETDERACAIVTAAGGTPPTLGELRDYLRDAGMSDWCWPDRLEVIDAMPRNAMGKIRKVDLRTRFRTP
ncbi:MAG TPA: AMP-binding protein [Streptosporangiaceae bacterium]|jgi:cyclohexanecarboxylate-CoA ligase